MEVDSQSAPRKRASTVVFEKVPRNADSTVSGLYDATREILKEWAPPDLPDKQASVSYAILTRIEAEFDKFIREVNASVTKLNRSDLSVLERATEASALMNRIVPSKYDGKSSLKIGETALDQMLKVELDREAAMYDEDAGIENAAEKVKVLYERASAKLGAPTFLLLNRIKFLSKVAPSDVTSATATGLTASASSEEVVEVLATAERYARLVLGEARISPDKEKEKTEDREARRASYAKRKEESLTEFLKSNAEEAARRILDKKRLLDSELKRPDAWKFGLASEYELSLLSSAERDWHEMTTYSVLIGKIARGLGEGTTGFVITDESRKSVSELFNDIFKRGKTLQEGMYYKGITDTWSPQLENLWAWRDKRLEDMISVRLKTEKAVRDIESTSKAKGTEIDATTVDGNFWQSVGGLFEEWRTTISGEKTNAESVINAAQTASSKDSKHDSGMEMNIDAEKGGSTQATAKKTTENLDDFVLLTQAIDSGDAPGIAKAILSKAKALSKSQESKAYYLIRASLLHSLAMAWAMANLTRIVKNTEVPLAKLSLNNAYEFWESRRKTRYTAAEALYKLWSSIQQIAPDATNEEYVKNSTLVLKDNARLTALALASAHEAVNGFVSSYSKVAEEMKSIANDFVSVQTANTSTVSFDKDGDTNMDTDGEAEVGELESTQDQFRRTYPHLWIILFNKTYNDKGRDFLQAITTSTKKYRNMSLASILKLNTATTFDTLCEMVDYATRDDYRLTFDKIDAFEKNAANNLSVLNIILKGGVINLPNGGAVNIPADIVKSVKDSALEWNTKIPFAMETMGWTLPKGSDRTLQSTDVAVPGETPSLENLVKEMIRKGKELFSIASAFYSVEVEINNASATQPTESLKMRDASQKTKFELDTLVSSLKANVSVQTSRATKAEDEISRISEQTQDVESKTVDINKRYPPNAKYVIRYRKVGANGVAFDLESNKKVYKHTMTKTSPEYPSKFEEVYKIYKSIANFSDSTFKLVVNSLDPKSIDYKAEPALSETPQLADIRAKLIDSLTRTENTLASRFSKKTEEEVSLLRSRCQAQIDIAKTHYQNEILSRIETLSRETEDAASALESKEKIVLSWSAKLDSKASANASQSVILNRLNEGMSTLREKVKTFKKTCREVIKRLRRMLTGMDASYAEVQKSFDSAVSEYSDRYSFVREMLQRKRDNLRTIAEIEPRVIVEIENRASLAIRYTTEATNFEAYAGWLKERAGNISIHVQDTYERLKAQTEHDPEKKYLEKPAFFESKDPYQLSMQASLAKRFSEGARQAFDTISVTMKEMEEILSSMKRDLEKRLRDSLKSVSELDEAKSRASEWSKEVKAKSSASNNADLGLEKAFFDVLVNNDEASRLSLESSASESKSKINFAHGVALKAISDSSNLAARLTRDAKGNSDSAVLNYDQTASEKTKAARDEAVALAGKNATTYALAVLGSRVLECENALLAAKIFSSTDKIRSYLKGRGKVIEYPTLSTRQDAEKKQQGEVLIVPPFDEDYNGLYSNLYLSKKDAVERARLNAETSLKRVTYLNSTDPNSDLLNSAVTMLESAYQYEASKDENKKAKAEPFGGLERAIFNPNGPLYSLDEGDSSDVVKDSGYVMSLLQAKKIDFALSQFISDASSLTVRWSPSRKTHLLAEPITVFNDKIDEKALRDALKQAVTRLKSPSSKEIANFVSGYDAKAKLPSDPIRYLSNIIVMEARINTPPLEDARAREILQSMRQEYTSKSKPLAPQSAGAGTASNGPYPESTSDLLLELVSYSSNYRSKLSQKMKTLQDALETAKNVSANVRKSHSALLKDVEQFHRQASDITKARTESLKSTLKSLEASLRDVSILREKALAAIPSVKEEGVSKLNVIPKDDEETLEEVVLQISNLIASIRSAVSLAASQGELTTNNLVASATEEASLLEISINNFDVSLQQLSSLVEECKTHVQVFAEIESNALKMQRERDTTEASIRNLLESDKEARRKKVESLGEEFTSKAYVFQEQMKSKIEVVLEDIRAAKSPSTNFLSASELLIKAREMRTEAEGYLSGIKADLAFYEKRVEEEVKKFDKVEEEVRRVQRNFSDAMRKTATSGAQTKVAESAYLRDSAWYVNSAKDKLRIYLDRIGREKLGLENSFTPDYSELKAVQRTAYETVLTWHKDLVRKLSALEKEASQRADSASSLDTYLDLLDQGINAFSSYAPSLPHHPITMVDDSVTSDVEKSMNKLRQNDDRELPIIKTGPSVSLVRRKAPSKGDGAESEKKGEKKEIEEIIYHKVHAPLTTWFNAGQEVYDEARKVIDTKPQKSDPETFANKEWKDANAALDKSAAEEKKNISDRSKGVVELLEDSQRKLDADILRIQQRQRQLLSPLPQSTMLENKISNASSRLVRARRRISEAEADKIRKVDEIKASLKNQCASSINESKENLSKYFAEKANLSSMLETLDTCRTIAQDGIEWMTRVEGAKASAMATLQEYIDAIKSKHSEPSRALEEEASNSKADVEKKKLLREQQRVKFSDISKGTLTESLKVLYEVAISSDDVRQRQSQAKAKEKDVTDSLVARKEVLSQVEGDRTQETLRLERVKQARESINDDYLSDSRNLHPIRRALEKELTSARDFVKSSKSLISALTYRRNTNNPKKGWIPAANLVLSNLLKLCNETENALSEKEREVSKAVQDSRSKLLSAEKTTNETLANLSQERASMDSWEFLENTVSKRIVDLVGGLALEFTQIYGQGSSSSSSSTKNKKEKKNKSNASSSSSNSNDGGGGGGTLGGGGSSASGSYGRGREGGLLVSKSKRKLRQYDPDIPWKLYETEDVTLFATRENSGRPAEEGRRITSATSSFSEVLYANDEYIAVEMNQNPSNYGSWFLESVMPKETRGIACLNVFLSERDIEEALERWTNYAKEEREFSRSERQRLAMCFLLAVINTFGLNDSKSLRNNLCSKRDLKEFKVSLESGLVIHETNLFSAILIALNTVLYVNKEFLALVLSKKPSESIPDNADLRAHALVVLERLASNVPLNRDEGVSATTDSDPKLLVPISAFYIPYWKRVAPNNQWTSYQPVGEPDYAKETAEFMLRGLRLEVQTPSYTDAKGQEAWLWNTRLVNHSGATIPPNTLLAEISGIFLDSRECTMLYESTKPSANKNAKTSLHRPEHLKKEFSNFSYVFATGGKFPEGIYTGALGNEFRFFHYWIQGLDTKRSPGEEANSEIVVQRSKNAMESFAYVRSIQEINPGGRIVLLNKKLQTKNIK